MFVRGLQFRRAGTLIPWRDEATNARPLQAGGEALLVHPDYLLSALSDSDYTRYASLRGLRERRTYRHGQEVLAGRAPLIPVKDAPPFTPAQVGGLPL